MVCVGGTYDELVAGRGWSNNRGRQSGSGNGATLLGFYVQVKAPLTDLDLLLWVVKRQSSAWQVVDSSIIIRNEWIDPGHSISAMADPVLIVSLQCRMSFSYRRLVVANLAH